MYTESIWFSFCQKISNYMGEGFSPHYLWYFCSFLNFIHTSNYNLAITENGRSVNMRKCDMLLVFGNRQLTILFNRSHMFGVMILFPQRIVIVCIVQP